MGLRNIINNSFIKKLYGFPSMDYPILRLLVPHHIKPELVNGETSVAKQHYSGGVNYFCLSNFVYLDLFQVICQLAHILPKWFVSRTFSLLR